MRKFAPLRMLQMEICFFFPKYFPRAEYANDNGKCKFNWLQFDIEKKITVCVLLVVIKLFLG